MRAAWEGGGGCRVLCSRSELLVPALACLGVEMRGLRGPLPHHLCECGDVYLIDLALGAGGSPAHP